LGAAVAVAPGSMAPAGLVPTAAPVAAGGGPAGAADDPFSAVAPAGRSTALSSLRRSRRNGSNAARVTAIAVLCLALVVLSALLVYVLRLR
jgi:hypothetical protein